MNGAFQIDQPVVNLEGPSFFIITGESGVGKSAIAAQLTQARDPAANHFGMAYQADTIRPLPPISPATQRLVADQRPQSLVKDAWSKLTFNSSQSNMALVHAHVAHSLDLVDLHYEASAAFVSRRSSRRVMLGATVS